MTKKRILVVDDQVSFTRLMKLHLEETGDYEVRTENLGKRLIAAAREFKPDLIVLDIVMPDLDGAQAAQDLKQQPDLKEIPVVFLTAMVSRDEVGAPSGVIGGHHFIAKPVNVKELIASIQKELYGDGKKK